VRDHNLRLLRWRTDLHSQEAADLHFRFDFGLRATTTRMLATTPESLAADVEFCLSSSATLTGHGRPRPTLAVDNQVIPRERSSLSAVRPPGFPMPDARIAAVARGHGEGH
jgi:hypothetical protein